VRDADKCRPEANVVQIFEGPGGAGGGAGSGGAVRVEKRLPFATFDPLRQFEPSPSLRAKRHLRASRYEHALRATIEAPHSDTCLESSKNLDRS